ncbi:MAG: hypothetical protein ACFFE2_12080 [Candidatus Thorarchaeota archaeon]
MPDWSLRRKSILGIVIGVLLSTTILGLADYVIVFDAPEGVTIDNTIFSNLQESGTYPLFDMSEMTVSTPSYYIDSNLWNQPLLTRVQAQTAVFAFLRLNLNESSLEDVTVWADLVDTQPTWAFIVEGPNVHTQIRVNAITGEIIGWNLSSHSSSKSNRVLVNSTEDVEMLAYQFLRLNNYSIPTTARFMGVNQYPSDLDGFYVEFHHYEGSFKVGNQFLNEDIHPAYTSEGITVRVSNSTGIVTQFGYRWTKIGEIPVFDVKSKDYAETIALRNSSAVDLAIVASRLSLIEIHSLTSQDGSPQLHLTWTIASNVSNKLWWLFVDAVSGEFLEERQTNGPVDIPVETRERQPLPVSIIPVALVSSVMVAIIAGYAQKRRIYQG